MSMNDEHVLIAWRDYRDRRNRLKARLSKKYNIPELTLNEYISLSPQEKKLRSQLIRESIESMDCATSKILNRICQKYGVQVSDFGVLSMIM
jgi:hypothetical protein